MESEEQGERERERAECVVSDSHACLSPAVRVEGSHPYNWSASPLAGGGVCVSEKVHACVFVCARVVR